MTSSRATGVTTPTLWPPSTTPRTAARTGFWRRRWGAAEDAVQEGYLAFWRQADRLSADRGSAEGLLLTVVHRRAVEAVRSRIRRRESADTVPDRVDLHAVDLLDAAITSMEGDRVRSALLALSPEHREAVELAYFSQLSHREIAERTGVPRVR